MKKRILSLVLALSMMISLFPVSALAQTPGGGGSALAEENGEDIDAANGADVTTIQIDSNGEPVTSGLDTDSDGYWVGNGWKYMDGDDAGLGTLTLMSGTWNLANQNAVKCYVAIDEKATVAGGTFENTVWNQAGGKISGGTFKKTIANNGTITGGIFVGVDLENTSVINSGEGKITGGVFKALPTSGIDSKANQYRIEFADAANTDTLSVNDVDFGTDKVYVVGMDNETLNVETKNTRIANVNDTLNTSTYRCDIDFMPSAVKLESETDSSTGVYLLKLNKTITKLEIGPNGCPITTGRETMHNGIYIAGHKGDSWTYGDSTLTLYWTNGGWDFSTDVELQCDVEVTNGAALKGGVFNKWVANWGTIENGVYRADVTNYYGTVENGIFLGDVGSSSTGYDSIVKGGVFKNEPSWVANGYTEHTITSYVSNRTIKVKIEGVLDFEDVGSSPVVVTKEGEGTTISVQLWEDGKNGKATTIRSLNGKAIGPDNCNSSWDESTKTLTFTTPATENIELNGPIENAELEFVSNYSVGVYYPDGTDFGQKSASGNGWSYVAETKTLTLTNGNYDLNKIKPTDKTSSEKMNAPIGGSVTIAKDAVVETMDRLIDDKLTIAEGGKILGGSISARNGITVEKGGTIENGTFSDEKIQNSGTIINGIYSGFTDVTNNAGGVIKGGKFRYNVTNNGGTIENGEFYYKVTNKGTINGGFFRSGVDNADTAVVGGGIFNGGTRLEGRNGISKVNVNGVKINRVNGVSAGSGMSMSYWGNIYTTCGTQLELQTLDGGYIYNLNGETNGYNVAGLGTNTVSFKMPIEGVVLNKTATLTVQSDVEGAVSTKPEQTVVINKAVLVTTDQQEGYYFAGWKVSHNLELTYNGEKVNLSRNRIVFDMPAENVTLTATYAKTPKYTLTVDGGYIGTDENQTSGNYEAGATIKLTAKDAAEGEQFEKWELTGLTLKNGYQETNATIEVTINGNATAKATYKDKTPTTYTLTLTDATANPDKTEYNDGDEITLTAKDAAEGKEFDKWELDGLTLVDDYQETNATIEVTITGNATATATYKDKTVTPAPGGDDDQPKTYTVTVKGGTINNETEVKAEKDIKLTVDVDEKEVPEGMTFDVWSIRFPEGIEDTLTPSVKLHDPHMTFTMPGADITIEAQYRSSELPGEDDGPSTLGTMATVAVGGAAAGILVWQGVSLGVDSYLQLNLPQGVAVPTNRRELVKLLWETAGKPETALPSLYSDVPAEEIELQKATRWAIDNGLVKPADDSDASRFDPDRYVTKYDVFGAWLKLKKLMK